MHRYTSKLSLHMRHPSRDLSKVVETLQLRPKYIWKSGDDRRSSTGTRIGGKRESSYCSVEIKSAPRTPLVQKIREALAFLAPHRRMLNRLTSTGGKVSLYVGWFCDENTGETFDNSVLRSMSELRVDLELNVYLPDQPKEL